MSLIDPSILASLGFLFNKTATIQAATETQNGYGEPVSTWATLAGHEAIPCVASPSGTRLAGIRPDHAPVIDTTKIMLQGFYPDIQTGMRAVVGSQTYTVISPQSDSQDLITTLICETLQ